VSTVNTFAGARIDRAGELRTDERWLSERLADPASRALVISKDGIYVDVSVDPPQPFAAPLAGLDASLLDEAVLLGVDAGGALFAVSADAGAAGLDGAVPMELREAGGLMSQADGGLAAYAAAITAWHRLHPHCSRCGARTQIAEAGHVRRCPNCGAMHHPRTDPVVIMLVHDGAERVLLGRQKVWPPGRYSTLAGFVEPGESLEEAVAREVLEESGIEVGEVLYRSSQPWPFPTSLMLGFHATYAGGEPVIGDGELEDVRWFDRDELVEIARDDKEIQLPPPLAIARQLIDEWLAS
jgi:NAD+ diphosphatase